MAEETGIEDPEDLPDLPEERGLLDDMDEWGDILRNSEEEEGEEIEDHQLQGNETNKPPKESKEASKEKQGSEPPTTCREVRSKEGEKGEENPKKKMKTQKGNQEERKREKIPTVEPLAKSQEVHRVKKKGGERDEFPGWEDEERHVSKREKRRERRRERREYKERESQKRKVQAIEENEERAKTRSENVPPKDLRKILIAKRSAHLRKVNQETEKDELKKSSKKIPDREENSSDEGWEEEVARDEERRQQRDEKETDEDEVTSPTSENDEPETMTSATEENSEDRNEASNQSEAPGHQEQQREKVIITREKDQRIVKTVTTHSGQIKQLTIKMCYRCGKRGHESPECRKKEGTARCLTCQEVGHAAPECPRMMKYVGEHQTIKGKEASEWRHKRIPKKVGHEIEYQPRKAWEGTSEAKPTWKTQNGETALQYAAKQAEGRLKDKVTERVRMQGPRNARPLNIQSVVVDASGMFSQVDTAEYYLDLSLAAIQTGKTRVPTISKHLKMPGMITVNVHGFQPQNRTSLFRRQEIELVRTINDILTVAAYERRIAKLIVYFVMGNNPEEWGNGQNTFEVYFGWMDQHWGKWKDCKMVWIGTGEVRKRHIMSRHFAGIDREYQKKVTQDYNPTAQLAWIDWFKDIPVEWTEYDLQGRVVYPQIVTVHSRMVEAMALNQLYPPLWDERPPIEAKRVAKNQDRNVRRRMKQRMERASESEGSTDAMEWQGKRNPRHQVWQSQQMQESLEPILTMRTQEGRQYGNQTTGIRMTINNTPGSSRETRSLNYGFDKTTQRTIQPSMSPPSRVMRMTNYEEENPISYPRDLWTRRVTHQVNYGNAARTNWEAQYPGQGSNEERPQILMQNEHGTTLYIPRGYNGPDMY